MTIGHIALIVGITIFVILMRHRLWFAFLVLVLPDKWLREAFRRAAYGADENLSSRMIREARNRRQ